MRWPLRKKPGEAPRARPEQSVREPVGVAARAHVEPAAHTERAPHPDRSRPRADWARLTPLAPVVAVPPVTFDGEQFGRSVPGGRSLTARHRPPTTSRSAPAGVLRDVATVEGILPPAPAEPVGDAALPAVPAGVHRKVAPARASEQLVTSDLELEFPTVALRTPPVGPVTWTPEEGFVDGASGTEADAESEPEPEASRMRMVRRRATPALPEPSEDEAGDDESPVPMVRFVPAAGRRIAPPRDLVDIVEQVTGVHVGDAVIDRSPQVTERAAEMGAVAFTEHGTVHLPEELGPIDDPAVRGIAAHELVHVAQHRVRQGDIPPEDSAEGRSLEASARAVQRAVGPGGAVIPAFVRSESSIPIHRSEGPVGVQRLANPASGVDFSDSEFSDTPPGTEGDPFRWQDRTDEPFEVPWEERRDWAQRFEQENATTLQRMRDQHHDDLMAQAGAGTPEFTSEAAADIRAQLDEDMPYQFGPPHGIEPYQDLAVRGAPLPTGGGRSSAGGPPRTPGRSLATTAAAARLTAAETAGAEQALVHLVSEARANYRPDEVPGDMFELFEERFKRERELRVEVLEAKRATASEGGADPQHVLELSDAEIARIREVVDIELPVGASVRPDYLGEQALRMTMGGVVDASSRAARRGGGRSPGSTPLSGIDAGRTGASEEEIEQQEVQADAAARAGLDEILSEARSQAQGAVSGYGGITERYEKRWEYELALRVRVLQAKVGGAIRGGARAGTTVGLEETDLTRIRNAVDTRYPMPIGNPQYLPSEESLSHQITEQDVRDRGAATPPTETEPEAESAATAAETAPTDETPLTDETAAATEATAEGNPAAATVEFGEVVTSVPQPAGGSALATVAGSVASVGAAAVATGLSQLLNRVANDESYGGDELAETVIDSLTEIDLEKLTRRLYGRIRRELRSELLIDRERAGSLADIR